MDPENETPPYHPQSIKLLSFPNGKPHNHLPPPPPPPLPQHTAVTYRECLKNHAARIGGQAVDGCGEFMPSPTEPTSFQCAACSCHRNFHRREPTIATTTATATRTHFIDFHRTSTSTSPSPPSPPPQPTNYAFGQNLILSLNNTAADHNHHQVATPGTPLAIKISGRKRFRTKFSQDQKDKMFDFAEKVGWKMQRREDKLIAEFCNEIGIRRRIFKVWMHNNKNTLAKKDSVAAVTTTVISTADTTTTATQQENGSGSSSTS